MKDTQPSSPCKRSKAADTVALLTAISLVSGRMARKIRLLEKRLTEEDEAYG